MIPFLQTDLPPSNLSYLIAAFVVTGVVFLSYIFFVFRRRKDTRAEINRLENSIGQEECAGGDEP